MKVILTAAALTGCVMALGAALPASAQVVKPAENPPAGFTGQQYVDSRGCVFMRAGFTGQVTWVPRIGRDRKPMCDEVTPAQAAARLAAGDAGAAAPQIAAPQIAAPVVAAPQIAAPVVAAPQVGAPLETVASAMPAGRKTGVFAPFAVPEVDQIRAVAAPLAPQRQLAQSEVAAPAQTVGDLGCPDSAPVLQNLPLSTGGTVAVCTRGDGSATGWISPTYRTGARPGAALQHGQLQRQPAARVVAGAAVAAQTGSPVQTVIAGQPILAQTRESTSYKAAWKDDRLNPNRGLGTAQGWADQAQVWTNKVPAQTHSDVADQKARRAAKWGNSEKRLTQSTMSAAAQPRAVPQGSGTIYVQVGSFGQVANAQNAAGRLAGMGLPVSSAKGVQGGKHLVAIMAGPFSNAADANYALKLARSAGFGDAFIR
jgi:hypothetical protein